MKGIFLRFDFFPVIVDQFKGYFLKYFITFTF